MSLSEQLKPFITDPKDSGTWSFGQATMPAAPMPGGPVLFASLIVNLFSLALPIVILQIYDRILPNEATDTLLALTAGLVLVLLLPTVTSVVRSSGFYARNVHNVHESDVKVARWLAPRLHPDL